MKIHTDELNHASWLKKAFFLVREGKIQFDEGKVKTYTIKAFIDHIKKSFEIILAPDTSLTKALVYIHDIEKSLIENKAFSYFKGIDPSLDIILRHLETETETHIKNIDDMLRQNR